ncbi:DUF4255 domain-containing protein [Sphingomonas sp.]|uniref:DUF4255 domain-containing protein n=1 Tax=Sphingomonas sp. TaxID=28214 RepID=UPI001B2F0D93|nr:DUF4255 domain-containing protein [Sphingomonas sp.]MBO9713883.1 DUF4255 domain-containing protein [Sphingomonas sp.]
MSEALAIPATTLVLKLLIEKRLKAAYDTLTPPPVSIAPPPQRAAVPPGPGPAPSPEGAGLYLFLHHVTPNPAWRNMYDPHVGFDGKRMGPAPVVLDLCYLVTAQGADLEREAILGVAVSALTRNAILPRPMITALLGSVSVNPSPTSIHDEIPKAPLADPAHQLESLAISQTPLDIDLSTKLWSALQSPLRPSAYFTVTTVFLDVDETFPAGIDVEKLRLGVWPDTAPRSDLPADNLVEVTP